MTKEGKSRYESLSQYTAQYLHAHSKRLVSIAEKIVDQKLSTALYGEAVEILEFLNELLEAQLEEKGRKVA